MFSVRINAINSGWGLRGWILVTDVHLQSFDLQVHDYSEKIDI